MKTYVQYPPRKLQSATYTGQIEISKYQQFQCGTSLRKGASTFHCRQATNFSKDGLNFSWGRLLFLELPYLSSARSATHKCPLLALCRHSMSTPNVSAFGSKADIRKA
jgi:hypothetical protein